MGKKILSQKTLAPIVNKIIAEYDIKLTVRQIYYRLVAKNVIPNTRSYYTSFDKLLTELREDSLVDPNAIEDRSRETIGGDMSWEESPEDFLEGEMDALEDCWERYNLPLWTSQQSYIEIWLEKDALSSLVSNVCQKYRVLLFPCRGYSSFTKVWEAVPRFGNNNSSVLYFGDHDPSGLQMEENLTDRLMNYGASVDVKRVALTTQQITKYSLPPQPVKATDRRSPSYVAQHGQKCWELDALPPDVLQKIVDRAIRDRIEWKAWRKREAEIIHGQVKVRQMLKKLMDSLKKT